MEIVKQAIIMAAGKGERLAPLTLETPKPLLLVDGKPFIESIVETLHGKGIDKVIIVIGYLKQQFYYLEEKYNYVILIENPYYDTYNNLSSLFVAKNYLDNNTIIMDGDLIIKNANILNLEIKKSSYCCSYSKDFTNEWLLKVRDNHIFECHRNGGENGYQLWSISKWLKNDAIKLRELVTKEFHNNNKTVYWDDIALNLYKNDFDLGIELINDEDIIEIDTYDEYINYINKKL